MDKNIDITNLKYNFKNLRRTFWTNVNTKTMRPKTFWQFFITWSSMGEKSTSLLRTIFHEILMDKKSTSFRHTFFDTILMDRKSTPFRRTFFHVILIGEKSTSFRRTFFYVISIVEKSTLFHCTLFGIFDAILMDWNLMEL